MLSMETLGERIAYLRNKHNLTQRQLMDYLKIENLSRYERNERRPSIDTITAIANFFNVSTDWLLLGKENRSTKYKLPPIKPKLTFPFKKKGPNTKDFAEHSSNYPFDMIFTKGVDLSKYAELMNTLETLPMEQIVEILEYAKYKAFKYISNTKKNKQYTVKSDNHPKAGLINFESPTKTAWAEKDGQSPPGLVPLPFYSSQADYALTIQDNSMAPAFPQGSIVFVKKQDTLEQEEIGIFQIDGIITCKKYRRIDEYILLEPLNKLHNALVLRKEDRDGNSFKIIGKVYVS